MSKADDNYKLLRTMLDERLKADKRLAAIADRIAKGKADFADTAKYTHIVSHHMGNVISENIGKITAPLGKEAVCKELLRDHYELINSVFGDVQVSVDEKMGIHIKPVKPAYPTERVDTWAHSLEDPTVEQSVIERRAASGSENIGNSMHDDCVKENAKLHDKAGLDCYLVRDAGGGCCAWCAAIAGRYKYADAPDDVFRRHDHCTCTTTYECGRMRQDVWSKRTWQASEKELEQRKTLSEASKPTVNTPEQAKELERQALEKSPITKLSPEQAKAIDEQSKATVNTPEQAAELEKQILESNDIDYMSKSFRPQYSDRTTELNIADITIPTKQVENSEFKIYADTEANRRNKAVRLTEKNLKSVQEDIPDGFEIPPTAVVDFEKYGLNPNAISGFHSESGIMFINSKYDTEDKILKFLNAVEGQFANNTTLAPILHEYGHKYYEDCVKTLAINENIGYNKAKDKIDSIIQNYIHEKTDGDSIATVLSQYAQDGYKNHSYTEIIAECFSVQSNPFANELIRLIGA